MKLLQGDLHAWATPGAATEFDVVVLGAGGAGLSAALFAALNGDRVLLVERTEFVGGTTAWSAGTTWIPGTHHAARVNPDDTLANAGLYLDTVVGSRSPRALRDAFLNHGERAVRRVEQSAHVRYRPYPLHPDYEADQAGATLRGRALEPLPFDGRLLGSLFSLLRPPLAEFTVLGGMMVDRTDINHLLGMRRSWASLRHSLRILARHALDRLSQPRGTRLVMGNALVARLLASLASQDHATLVTQVRVSAIERSTAGGRIDTVVLDDGQRQARVSARKGVIVASGGFNRHPQRRAQHLPGADIAWCPGAPGHTGELHDLLEGLGAVYGQGAANPAFWAPVSRRQRADGSWAVFPHFVLDRAKPGFVTIDAQGDRFVNESTSYHRFALAMQGLGDRQDQTPVVPA